MELIEAKLPKLLKKPATFTGSTIAAKGVLATVAAARETFGMPVVIGHAPTWPLSRCSIAVTSRKWRTAPRRHVQCRIATNAGVVILEIHVHQELLDLLLHMENLSVVDSISVPENFGCSALVPRCICELLAGCIEVCEPFMPTLDLAKPLGTSKKPWNKNWKPTLGRLSDRTAPPDLPIVRSHHTKRFFVLHRLDSVRGLGYRVSTT